MTWSNMVKEWWYEYPKSPPKMIYGSHNSWIKSMYRPQWVEPVGPSTSAVWKAEVQLGQVREILGAVGGQDGDPLKA